VGRKKRTHNELRRVYEHLHYEVQMLLGSAQGLVSEIPGEGTLHNALVRIIRDTCSEHPDAIPGSEVHRTES
jgi:hypothetical protein